jgi:hypothetical protein
MTSENLRGFGQGTTFNLLKSTSREPERRVTVVFVSGLTRTKAHR